MDINDPYSYSTDTLCGEAKEEGGCKDVYRQSGGLCMGGDRCLPGAYPVIKLDIAIKYISRTHHALWCGYIFIRKHHGPQTYDMGCHSLLGNSRCDLLRILRIPAVAATFVAHSIIHYTRIPFKKPLQEKCLKNWIPCCTRS